MQVPGTYVLAGLPTVKQIGTGDVVLVSLGQVLADLADDIGPLHPGQPGRMVQLLEQH